MKNSFPRRFVLNRTKDHSGVSGVGVIAQGVEFANGKVVISWLTPISSLGFFDSISTLDAIHGHEGSTEVVWEPDAPTKKTRKTKTTDQETAG